MTLRELFLCQARFMCAGIFVVLFAGSAAFAQSGADEPSTPRAPQTTPQGAPPQGVPAGAPPQGALPEAVPFINARPVVGEQVRGRHDEMSTDFSTTRICSRFGCEVRVHDRRTGELVTHNGHVMDGFAYTGRGTEIVRTKAFRGKLLSEQPAGGAAIEE